MKLLTFYFAFLFSFSGFCKIQLDTIYANEHQNVALFFPEPIRQGIAGSENIIFSYNRDTEQYFGLLKAKPGKASNLLIISKNGLIFSYIVKYKEKPKILNHFIKIEASIGNEKPVQKKTLPRSEEKKEVSEQFSYFERASDYLIDHYQKFNGKKARTNGISLKLDNIVYEKDLLYFVMEIENRSNLNYDLNYLKFSIETRLKGKRKSTQSLYQQPTFVSDKNPTIKANSSTKLVYILSKFSLSTDQRLRVELAEDNGSRNVDLILFHRKINNPN